MKINSKAEKVKITSGNDGQRLDNFLLTYIKQIPKSHIYKLIRTGQVRINSTRSKASSKLYKDDIVRIPPYKYTENLKPSISNNIIQKINKNIIFEDEDILIYNKPPFFAVHSGTNIGYGLIDVLRATKKNCERIDLVHRLDKNTSGLIIIAKNMTALRYFQKEIKHNNIEKKYICLVDGLWDKEIKKYNINLLRNNKSSMSLSKFKILKTYKTSTLLEVEIVTGKYHQIRKQCASLNHPILGDTKYGDNLINKKYKKLGLGRIFLHAHSLSFFSINESKKKMIKSNLTEDLSMFLDLHE